MSKITFNTLIDMSTAATPSSGFTIGYDLDGILKQKDPLGVVTPLGATGAAGISGFTASNGLTQSGANVKLGGYLIENTTIDGSNNTFEITGLSANSSSKIELYGGNVAISLVEGNTQLNDWSSTGFVSVQTNGGGLYLNGDYNGGQPTVELSAGNINTALRIFGFGTSSGVSDGSSNNRFIIYDESQLKGLVYRSDYSANFTSNSLISKKYVDDKIIGSGFTTSNGLTRSGSDIKLGGYLIENTTINANFNGLSIVETSSIFISTTGSTSFIDMNSSGGWDGGSYISTIHSDSSVSSESYVDGTRISLRYDNSGFTVSTHMMDNNQNQIKFLVGSFSSELNLGKSSNVFTDTFNNKGLVYASDYSSNFTLESLVSKRYVDSKISGNGVTASGTINYISKFTGINTLGNSLIFDNGTNVGIGTSSPTVKLHVMGNATFDNRINAVDTTINLISGSSSSGSYLNLTDTNFGNFVKLTADVNYANIELQTGNGGNISFKSSGNYDTRIISYNYASSILSRGPLYIRDITGVNYITTVDTTNNRLGINTVSPSVGLHIYATQSGTFRLQDTTEGLNKVLISDTNGVGTWASIGSIGIGTTNKSVTTTGFTASITKTIIHNLNTSDVLVQTYDSTGLQIIAGYVSITGTGSVDITFSQTLSGVKTIIIG